MIKDHVSLNFDTVLLTGPIQKYSCRSFYRRVTNTIYFDLHYLCDMLNLIIFLQCWRQLSKLQKLIFYLLTSVILISLLLWFIGTSRNLEELSETNSLKLPQPTIWPQDNIVCLITNYDAVIFNGP